VKSSTIVPILIRLPPLFNVLLQQFPII